MDAMDICMDSELLSCTNETTEVIQNILDGIIAKNPGLVNSTTLYFTITVKISNVEEQTRPEILRSAIQKM